MRHICNSLLLLALTLPASPAPAADETAPTTYQPAPYENFPAADFSRGERYEKGAFSIGAYTHYMRFTEVVAGNNTVDDPTDPEHTRWIPVLFLDYQFTEQFHGIMLLHGASVITSSTDPVTARRVTGRISGPSDLYLLVQWSPWLGNLPAGHTHTFFDAHNLSFVFGPRFDLGKTDPAFGLTPDGTFRATSLGAHYGNAGVVYVGHLNDNAWLYDFGYVAFPLGNTSFGMQPGLRFGNKVGLSWVPDEAVQLFWEAEFDAENQGRGGSLPLVAANNGGSSLHATTGLTADISSGWGLEASLTLPVMHFANGQQPSLTSDIFFGIYKNFPGGAAGK